MQRVGELSQPYLITVFLYTVVAKFYFYNHTMPTQVPYVVVLFSCIRTKIYLPFFLLSFCASFINDGFISYAGKQVISFEMFYSPSIEYTDCREFHLNYLILS